MKTLTQDQRLLKLIFGTDKSPLVIHDSIEQITTNEISFLIPGKSKEVLTGYNALTFNYILNADKSIRWIANNQSKQPFYLSFYNAHKLKSKVYVELSKLLHKTGLKRLLFDGSFTIYLKEGNSFLLDQSINELDYDEKALFLGTTGPNRKISVALIKNKKVENFLKMGTSVLSIASVMNEKKAYKLWKSLNLTNIRVGEVSESKKSSAIVVKNVKGKSSVRASKLNRNHILALKEVYFKTNFNTNPSYDYKEHIAIQLNSLKVDSRFNFSELLNKRLLKLRETLDERKLITTIAHGDFTPWNFFENKDGTIGLYDLESTKRAPLFFDIFHFIYQNQILTKQGDLKTINEAIKEVFQIPELKQLVEQYKLDVNEYHKWYLLEHVSASLNYYQLQDNLHEQVYWLVNAWNMALSHFDGTQQESEREVFTNEIFTKLKHDSYVLLKNQDKPLDELDYSSDLDLLMEEELSETTLSWIEQHALVKKLAVKKQSFMTSVSIYFKDDSFLSIDLINTFKRKRLIYLNAKKMLVSYREMDGVKVPQLTFDFEYITKFYLLNKSQIPTKYIKQFNRLNSIQRTTIMQHLNNTLNVRLTNLEEVNLSRSILTKRLKRQLKANMTLAGLLTQQLSYVRDTFKNLIFTKGQVVTFSGVDGAGKTTILNDVVDILKSKYRKEVIVLRHRPSVLPILSSFKHGKKKAEEIAANNLPRKGTNKNVLASYLRFAYYYTDYVFGQLYIKLKYTSRGKTIVYDRYYFDFISDPKRSNLTINPSIAKFLYRLVFKPDLNILLYAPSKEILKRKQELSSEAIENLTLEYTSLFKSLKKKKKQAYITIENINKQETLNKIIKAYNVCA